MLSPNIETDRLIMRRFKESDEVFQVNKTVTFLTGK